MANLFNSIFVKKPKYNRFNLSHEVKLTCNFGEIVPFLVQDVIPGDKFKISTEFLCRLAPMISPVMHRINVFMYYHFVPNRLIFKDWETFITGGKDGKQTAVSPRYKISAAQANEYLRPGKLADYLGFPVKDFGDDYTQDVIFDALPFRAYRKIYNDYFRDQNLEDELDTDDDSSGIIELSDIMANQLLNVHRKAWHKDYFTSALPWTQRGDAVKIPMSGEVTMPGLRLVRGSDLRSSSIDWNEAVALGPYPGSLPNGGYGLYAQGSLPAEDDPTNRLEFADNAAFQNVETTLNELRTAYRVQRWLERNAVGGARYIEQIMAHFGVKSSDARLQRAEYLGGSKNPVVISEVLQTSSTDATSPQGNMSGRGVSLGKSRYAKKYAEEHGFIIGTMAVVPKSGYMQGLPRKFQRVDKYDYYWPEFAHLGEQAIRESEIYYDFNSESANEQTFGYTPRYAEYRFNADRVCGDFRGSMDNWHLARKFAHAPRLNTEFVQVRAYESDLNRIFAVEEQERYNVNPFWCQLLVNESAKRLIPKFGTPQF